jgi:branched-chain amino acid transport system substrate-binding protein
MEKLLPNPVGNARLALQSGGNVGRQMKRWHALKYPRICVDSFLIHQRLRWVIPCVMAIKATRLKVLKRILVFGLALATVIGLRQALAKNEPILIGEISSYSALPIGTEAYRKGWQLAVDEINQKGGLLGQQIEILSRDDAGSPDVALTAANELFSRYKVEMLTGTTLSNVGLAVADFSKQKGLFFLATQPLTDALIWENGNTNTFRLSPSTFAHAMVLAEEAAKLPAKRWATIAPNYEFGQSAVASFKSELKRLRPDVEFVSEQWPPLGKMDAGAMVQAVASFKPEAIFNATFGSDLVKLVREGNLRDLFKDRPIISILTGEPEYLDSLKDETPKGWIVTGYPWSSINTPDHAKFLAAYRARYKDYPRMGSLMGYSNILVLAEAIKRAGSTDTEALVTAMKGLTVVIPAGVISFRAIDHQSTMGVYVGRLDIENGHGVMVDWRYEDGARLQPSDDFVRAHRKEP